MLPPSRPLVGGRKTRCAPLRCVPDPARAICTDDAAVHLLFSANRWEAVKSLKARLNAGETLVCDRYAFSGVAFTAAKGTLDLEWCKNPDRGLPAPDAVIYLDVTSVSPPAAHARHRMPVWGACVAEGPALGATPP
jgi:hypothetical protein